MEALKYLKLDLRIMKEKRQYIFLTLSLILLPIIKYDIEVGITFLLIFVILYAMMPFSNENADELGKMYNIFPSKSSSMVLGRFMYLSIITIIMALIYVGIGGYSFRENQAEGIHCVEIGGLLTISIISCYCAYPIYYKAQMEKENMAMTGIFSLIILAEFSAMLLMPMILRVIITSYNEKLNLIADFIINNSKIFIFLDLLMITIIVYISYLISCRICKRKEV